MVRPGRKTIYGDLLADLEDDRLYSYSDLSDLGVRVFQGPDTSEKDLRKRIKSTMYGRAKRYRFPTNGDGLLHRPGYAPSPAWLGSRWKQTLYSESQGLGTEVQEKAESTEATAVKTRRSRRQAIFARIRHRKALLVLAIALGLIGGWVFNPWRVFRGYELLRDEGPKAAQAFYEGVEVQGEELISKGWAALRTENYEQAADLAHRVLAKNDELKGSGLYLLSQAELFTGDLDGAARHLREALDFYEAGGFAANAYLACVGLARIALEMSVLGEAHFEDTEFYLNRALGYRTPTGSFYYLRARLAFEKGAYTEALTWSQAWFEKFEDADNRAQALLAITFYHLILGDTAAGYASLRKTEVALFGRGDDNFYKYHQINEYLFAKCMGYDGQITWDFLMELSQKHTDPVFRRVLFFAENFNCHLMN